MSDPKWHGGDVISFLNLYRQYPCLWDVTSPEYLKRDLKRKALHVLLGELEDIGLPIEENCLKKKIKVLRDTYRIELNKVNKSKKSETGTDVYKPKLMWFSVADSFLNSVISCRTLSSNLDSSTLTQDKDGVGNDLEVCSDESEASAGTSTPKLVQPCKKIAASTMFSPRPAKIMKTNCITKYPSRFESAIDKLRGIAMVASEGLQPKTVAEDQYDTFAKHIASQMRELPIRSFIVLQHKFQELLTEERLAQIEAVQPQPRFSPTTSSGHESGSSSCNLYNQPQNEFNTDGLDIVPQHFLNIKTP